MPTKKATGDTDQIQLTRLEKQTVHLEIKGLSPLIVHRFTEKSKQQMLDKQMMKKTPKQPKDPNKDFEESIYRLPDASYGFPCVAFKAATVDAARYFTGIHMTELRRMLSFAGEGPEQLVRLNTSGPVMKEDAVRLETGVADLRYRAMFPDWSATLAITFLPARLDLDSVIALVDAGGMGGIGEWRPSGRKSSGEYGMYQVVER